MVTRVIRIVIAVFLLIFGSFIIYMPSYYANSSAPDLVCAKVIFNTNVCNRVRDDYRAIGAILIVIATIFIGVEIVSTNKIG